MKFIGILPFIVAFALCTVPACAQGLSLPGADDGGDLVKVRGMIDRAVIAPGQAFHLAIIFEIKPKWHIYWRNPGAGAAAPEVFVTAPEGFLVQGIRWPRPHVRPSQTGDMYTYDDQAVLLVPIKAPATLRDGRVQIEVDVNWAVCDDRVCKLGSGDVSASARTIAAPSDQSQPDPRLDRFRSRLPRPVIDVDGASATFDGSTLTVTAPAMGHEKAMIISDFTPGVVFGAPQISIESDIVTARVPIDVQPQNSLGKDMFVAGLLMLDEKDDDPSIEFRIPVENAKENVNDAD